MVATESIGFQKVWANVCVICAEEMRSVWQKTERKLGQFYVSNTISVVFPDT